MLALLVPAVAQAAATISEDGGALRFVGDAGPNVMFLWGGSDTEWELDLDNDTVPGPGCRHRDDTDGGNHVGNFFCKRAGIERLDVETGAGDDYFDVRGGGNDVPVTADMGDGSDHFDIGSPQTDDVQLGPGNDFSLDGYGNDRIDGGPGDDNIWAIEPGSGDDTIIGGEGDDNLDGKDGNDTIDAGPGNDLTQGSAGDDTVDGGEGDDRLAGISLGSNTCSEDPGNDVMRGGPGNDQICGGTGIDAIDGGPGDDAVSSLDNAPDAFVSCGEGSGDVVWSDVFDPVALDCEQQGDPRTVTLPSPDLLPVPLPCAPGACTGTVTVYPAPGAAPPQPGVAPERVPTAVAGKALVRTKFKLKAHAKRTLRLKLGKRAAKRLKKLGATTVEARTTFRQAGKTYSVRRRFGVKRR